MSLRVGRRWLVLAFLVVAAGWTGPASAQTLTIAWDPSPDPYVVGYIVYAGTQSGEYTAQFNVGTATSFAYDVVPEQPYFFAVASYADGMLVGPLSTEVVGTAHAPIVTPPIESPPQVDAPPPVDTTPPVVTITLPTSTARLLTSESSVLVGGTATDDVGVVAVTWASSRGSGGIATGTDMWIAGIPLHSGRNDITITAVDAFGNAGSAAISVFRQTSSP